MVNIIKDFYTSLGLWENHWVSLSVRDYAHPEKYIGEPKDWDLCESMLQEISDEMGLNAKKCEGEAALYGPKLDFMFKDAMGKEIQIPTVQLDFATPKRFGLTYVDNKINLAIGNYKDHIMAGPIESIKKHCKDYIELQSGKDKPGKIAKLIQHKIKGELDDIIRALPAGTFKVKK